MLQRHAVYTIPLLAVLLLGAVTPASAAYYDHKGTFALGRGWNNPIGTSGDDLTKVSHYYVPPSFDPWWGWIGGGWVPGESVTGSHADSGFGFSVGVGVDFQIDHGTSLVVDARDHHADIPGVDMNLIPISFGFRG